MTPFECQHKNTKPIAERYGDLQFFEQCTDCNAKRTSSFCWVDLTTAHMIEHLARYGDERFEQQEAAGPSPEHVKAIADLTVELVRLRQNECKHLSVENVAAGLFADLLTAYRRTMCEEHSGLDDPFRVEIVDMHRGADAPPSGDVMD